MLHEELRPSGVTVTVLCPGGVATEFAAVAEMGSAERRMRAFVTDVETVAQAGIGGLERGRRKVVPTASARALTFAGGHLPRGLWLRACRRMMT
jgi:hypothetical protein